MIIRTLMIFFLICSISVYSQGKSEKGNIEVESGRQSNEKTESEDTVSIKTQNDKAVKKAGKPAEEKKVEKVSENGKDSTVSISDSNSTGKQEYSSLGEKETLQQQAEEDPEEGTSGSSSGNGILYVNTEPESALIIFDDEKIGKSPLAIQGIFPGKHILEIRKKGYYLKKVTVKAVEGMEESVTFSLIAPGKITVKSDPAGAAVFINRKKQGVTPLTKSTLKPGKYNIVVDKEGFELIEKEVVIKNGEEKKMDLDLLPAAGREKSLRNKKSTGKDESKDNEKTKKSLLNRISIGLFIAFSLIIIIVEIADS